MEYEGAPSSKRQAAAAATAAPSLPSPPFTFVELFAGIGGFRVGLEPLGGQCVFACELDAEARETYRLNFEAEAASSSCVSTSHSCTRENLWGDVTDIDLSVPEGTQEGSTGAVPAVAHGVANAEPPHTLELPVEAPVEAPVVPLGFDLLTAGFPCQSFTLAGARRGLGEDRGQLFFEIIRFLEGRRPRAFLLENVVNLLWVEGGSRKERRGGAALATILGALSEAGYTVVYRAIHSQAWVPQKRERLYFVGFRNDVAPVAMRAFQWPEKAGPPEDRSTPRDEAETGVKMGAEMGAGAWGGGGGSGGGSGGGGGGTGSGNWGNTVSGDGDRDGEYEVMESKTDGGRDVRRDGVLMGSNGGGGGAGGDGDMDAGMAGKCDGDDEDEDTRETAEARRWTCGVCVGDVLQSEERGADTRADTRACELSEAQWKQVVESASYQKEGGDARRLVDVGGVARTVMSSYRSGFRYHAELVPPLVDAGGIAQGGGKGKGAGAGAEAEKGEGLGDTSHRTRPRFFTRREYVTLYETVMREKSREMTLVCT